MSMTTKSGTAAASAVHQHPLALTMSQREALQKFTVWRNSFDDRGDLFGGAAIDAMLLQELVGQVARVADELCHIAQKPTPAFPSLPDVETYLMGKLVPVNDTLDKHQKEIEAGAAQSAKDREQVRHDVVQVQETLQSLGATADTQALSIKQNQDRIETLTSHLSGTDAAAALARQQIEREAEHLLRHGREIDALRQRLDALAENVERFVAEADWDLVRGLITLEERVKCLEDAEPRPGPQRPSRSQAR
jgi:hypothetical protein